MARWEGDSEIVVGLANAIGAINKKVDLMGVVVETSIPRKSKGTDYYCTLSIVDESRPDSGISVNVFSEDIGKLPQVQYTGDIIQLSRVVMKRHYSDVYVLFNKTYSAFALYEGKRGTDFVPYQVSSKFRSQENDKKLIEGLRRWLDDNQLDSGSDDYCSLKEIKENECFNLVCKVIHLCEVSKDEWILFVWDGSDTPITTQKKQEDEMEDPLPLQLECSPLTLDILRMFPTVGTVLRVYITSANEKLGLHILKIGRWVKIMKMRCEIREGLWRGVLMPFTKIRCLADDNELVLICQRVYDERMNSKFGRMPQMNFPWASQITETDYPDVGFCTLMDVLAYPEVTAKFNCVVRVIELYPWRAENYLSPLGVFRIRLTLEDPTARIHAFVYAKDGIDLFGGVPPTEELRRKRNMLVDINSSGDDNELKHYPRNAPWVQCCIKSYYLDESDVWGSRRYRIFGTRVVDKL